MKFDVWKLSIISDNWENEDDFIVYAHCEIRERNGVAGEALSLNIASPKAMLRGEVSDGFRYEFGRGYIIVNDYDQNKILASMQKLIDGACADDWNQLTSYVEKYFDWI